jgi:RNA polymerase sigma-70 factor (ECF subfamily)
MIGPHLEAGYRTALAILRDPDAAHDAVQESAFKAWRKLGQLREGRPARPWFLAIVANQCRSARRAKWWSVQRLAQIAHWPSRDDRWAERMDLDAALERLPHHHLEVLVLYYHLDLPIDEVARVLGCSQGGARQRIHRALAALRPRMMLEVSG